MPEHYHGFALFDPPKMGKLMNPGLSHEWIERTKTHHQYHPQAAITTTVFSHWPDIFLILKSETVKTLGSFQTYSKWIQWFWSGPNLATEKNLIKPMFLGSSSGPSVLGAPGPFPIAALFRRRWSCSTSWLKWPQSWDPKRIIRSRKRQCAIQAIHVLFFPSREAWYAWSVSKIPEK